MRIRYDCIMMKMYQQVMRMHRTTELVLECHNHWYSAYTSQRKNTKDITVIWNHGTKHTCPLVTGHVDLLYEGRYQLKHSVYIYLTEERGTNSQNDFLKVISFDADKNKHNR